MIDWPSVGVVMPTRHRPQQLRAAVDSVLAQDYPGELRVAVVCDESPAAPDLTADQRIEVMANDRTTGLAGARNTGVLALETVRRVRLARVALLASPTAAAGTVLGWTSIANLAPAAVSSS